MLKSVSTLISIIIKKHKKLYNNVYMANINIKVSNVVTLHTNGALINHYLK